MPYFHHVSLLTRARQTNVDFYTQLLGLRFVKNTVNQDNHKMLHYYYGDYAGSPGSVVTFFVVPHLGQRYDEDHYLATIGFNLPQASLAFWEARLKDADITYTKEQQTLTFFDADGVKLSLTETTLPPLTPELATQHTTIPPEKQIIGLRSTEFHVVDPELTKDFFAKLLAWPTIGDTLQLSAHEFLKILPSGSRKKSRMGRGSMDHVALAVKDDDALTALYQKAQAQGWEIEKIVSRGYFKSLYIREPGGNRVEFATMAPGFTLDEPLAHLGESFALPPFLASQRAEIEKNLYVVDEV